MAARLDAKQRQQARDLRTRQRRQAFYAQAMAEAASDRERLAVACQYLRAACDGLPDDEVRAVTAAVVALAEERNPA